jgi:pimeloyl-ACP methyl ester carboxylesterase
MATKILPKDSRIRYAFALINGQTYGYIRAEPTGTPHGTIFLLHGFPDLSFGWRYQIPLFMSLGLRVIAPDLMGYGLTSAPESPAFYTYKRAADDMAVLARQLGCENIFLGGHDWGGLVVFRLAMRYPRLVSAMFTFATRFSPPRNEYVAYSSIPIMRYQLQFQGPQVEANVVGEEAIRQALNAIYGGKGPDGLAGFDMSRGLYFERLQDLQRTSILSEDELDFYAAQYVKNGMHGPMNWYRTGEPNSRDDKELGSMESFKFKIPMLFIRGIRDVALPRSFNNKMGQYFTNLRQYEVEGGHWAHWEQPEEVNKYVKEFFVDKVDTTKICHLGS